MKVLLAGAAVAAFMTAFGGAASATMICTNDCNHAYNVCNAMNGGSAQQVCMPKWMQCKKSCSAPAKPTPISTAPTKPRH
jgi:hypothetical protein